MFTLINKTTGREIRSHNMFRVSSPFSDVELGENEQLAYIPDDSPFLDELQGTYDCTLVVDREGTITGLTIIKTLEQYQLENPPAPQPPSRVEELESILADLVQVLADKGVIY